MKSSKKRQSRPHKIHRQVLTLNAREHFWVQGDTILIGVSGGGDSMCLLHVLSELRKKERLSLVVAHVNYGVRGHDADRDKRHVENTCKRMNIPFFVHKCTMQEEVSSEKTMRDVRHHFFQEIIEQEGAHKIALAHTRNDHAETLFGRLMRGAGLAGLGNMSYRDGEIIRPLLDLSTAETRAYCRDVGIRYFHDYTNNTLQYTRNRIRHQTLPHLARAYNAQIVRILSSTAHRLNDAAHLQKYLVYDRPIIPWKKEEGRVTFAQEIFRELTPPLRRTFLYVICRDTSGHPDSVTYKTIRDIEHMITTRKSKNKIYSTKDLIVESKNATVEITLQR